MSGWNAALRTAFHQEPIILWSCAIGAVGAASISAAGPKVTVLGGSCVVLTMNAQACASRAIGVHTSAVHSLFPRVRCSGS